MTGYSGTPLLKKLGIKPGVRVGVLGDPGHVTELLGALPPHTALVRNPRRPCELFLVFSPDHRRLMGRLRRATALLPPDGAIWVCWPKRSSGVATDVTEDVVRHEALAAGLVDVKVCAVDDTWSGLKLVVPVATRPEWSARELERAAHGHG